MSCAALFEELLPQAGGSAAVDIIGERAEGTAAAVAIYEQALAAAPAEACPSHTSASIALLVVLLGAAERLVSHGRACAAAYISREGRGHCGSCCYA